jgi:hypothetical protein
MKKISRIVGQIIPLKIVNSMYFLSEKAKKDWVMIVGKAISEFTELSRIIKSKDGLTTAYISALPSSSFIVRYNEHLIKERLSRYLVPLKVNALKIIQTTNIKKYNELSSDDSLKRKKKQQTVDDIKNDSLRSALEALKTEILDDAA